MRLGSGPSDRAGATAWAAQATAGGSRNAAWSAVFPAPSNLQMLFANFAKFANFILFA